MSADEAPLAALFVPFADGALTWPGDDRVLVLGARDGAALRAAWRPGWVCQQDFKPPAEALARFGAAPREPAADERFARVCVLPPRQRAHARALLARAAAHLAPGGVLVASVANAQGAGALQGDLQRLVGPLRSRSKHKCRVLISSAALRHIDDDLLCEWVALDAVQSILDGAFFSRPGLFSWDRIDPASRLLAEHLPADLRGDVADLGAGYGYLASQVLARCPRVTTIDLYEAQARALAPARINLEQTCAARAGSATFDLHWHDVTRGLPRRYDAIVSNPPFHQGRADAPQLGQAFIAAAARALHAHGQFLMVANRHLPYEATLGERFTAVRELAARDGFKVFVARGPRA